MLFNSLEFLIFFPLVVIFYYSLPPKYRWILLLGASYYFYMCWKAEYILLIILSTVIDYIAGLKMGQTDDKRKRRLLLIMSMISNLGILFFFKYFNFFSDSVRSAFDSVNIFIDIPVYSLLLPVGISFYTFQSMSYTIDVYRGKQQPEKHFGIFALYVSFFPQLVAGPIERSTNLLPQFKKVNKFEYSNVTDGLKLMLWGFFKKLVIADNLAIVVNQVYNNVDDYTGIHYIIATIFFAYQIYADFSGYSDIAIGGAQVMGYKLMKNFNRPYYSKSISEFWKRWHISLSTWFKDYLYISLGGNRVVKWRWYYNLFITFLVSGLWHGANWTFVIWGGLNGFYLVFSIFSEPVRNWFNKATGLTNMPKLHRFLKVMITFSLTCLAWVFFRANSVADAIKIIANMTTDLAVFFKTVFLELFFTRTVSNGDYFYRIGTNELSSIINRLHISVYDFTVIVFALIFLELFHLLQRKGSMRETMKTWPLWLRWFSYYIVLFMILVFGQYDIQEFIYFQF